MSSMPDELQVVEHARFLQRLVRSIVSDEHAADDVAQETWLAAHASPPRDSAFVAGWFARVARRLMGRMRRGERRRVAREQAVARTEQIGSTVQAVSHEETLRIVTQAVLALDDPYRSAVMMRYYEELAPEEIARRCEVPVATVRSRLQRAKEKLRERLTVRLGPDLHQALAWFGGIPAGAAASTAAAATGAVATTIGAKLVLCGGVVVAVGAALWIGGAAGSRPVHDGSNAAPAAAQTAEKPAEPAAPVAARDRESAPSATATDSPVDARGSGAITLAIVDAGSRAPLPDTPVLVYSERPSLHVFKRAVTDAGGSATIRELPSDVILFETGRRPPHANTIFATWLRSGEQKSVTMALGRGGSVRGRVVDDAGQPIAGVEVAVDSRPGDDTLARMKSLQGDDSDVLARFASRLEPVTKSDRDGRFEVDAILARPAAVWIEHGTMSPKRKDPVLVDLRWRLFRDRIAAKTDEGVTTDLPDVVWDRPSRYAGRVFGTDGAPVGGALVSTRIERSTRLGERAFDAPFIDERPGLQEQCPEGPQFRFDLAPWESGFTLAFAETVTAADGSFEVESGQWNRTFVAARDGSRKLFDLPKAGPGAVVDGLELRLPVETQFELEITDADGAPLPARSPSGFPTQVELFAVTRDGVEVRGGPKRAGPTSYGVSFELAPAAIAQLVVTARDRVAASHAFEAPPVGRQRLVFALAQKPSFDLPFHLHYADESDGPLFAEWPLRLIARLRARSAFAGGSETDGDGVLDTIDFQPKITLSLKFHVPSRGPWFVSLRGPFLADSPELREVDLGSFEPDGTTHEVEIPKANGEWLAAQQKKRELDLARGTVGPPQHVQGMAHFTFVDADTRAVISIERLHYEFIRVGEPSQSAAPEMWYSTSGDRGSRSFPALGASPGHYTFKVAAHGYRDSAPVTLTILADESVDGGTIPLEPIPERRVRLVRPDGTPVGGGWQIELFDPATFGTVQYFYGFDITTDASGVASIRRELPQRFLLMAWPPNASFGGPQLAVRHELAPWPVGQTRDLTIPPMQRVTVVLDVSAIDAALRDSSCFVQVQFDDDPMPRNSIGGQAADSPIPEDGKRRYSFTAPPGRYRLRASARLFVVPDATVEVTADGGRQEFRLVAQPR